MAFFAGNSSTKHTLKVFLPAGKKVRVSLSWLIENSMSIPDSHANWTPTVGDLADLDLHVYAPSGPQVAYSATVYQTTEIVEFTTSVAGIYTIEVSRYSGCSSKTYWGLAYWYEDDFS